MTTTPIGLVNHLFEPCDDTGEKLASYALVIPSDDRIAGDLTRSRGQWYTLKLAWTDSGDCTAALDDSANTALKFQRPPGDGPCYFRLRSPARSVNAVGFMIESVSVTGH